MSTPEISKGTKTAEVKHSMPEDEDGEYIEDPFEEDEYANDDFHGSDNEKPKNKK